MIILENRVEEGDCLKQNLCFVHRASHMEWADYSKIENELVLECPHCDWMGKALLSNGESGDSCIEFDCGQCQKALLFAWYPLVRTK
jgi:hypothetical protein